MTKRLDGLKILVLEDEFLIAMDVEQLCRDNGADHVTIIRSIDEIDHQATHEFDAAIVDVMLGGTSTLEFAALLRDAKRPFVFASGYTDNEELARSFPDVALVAKPYSESDLIDAIASARARLMASGST